MDIDEDKPVFGGEYNFSKGRLGAEQVDKTVNDKFVMQIIIDHPMDKNGKLLQLPRARFFEAAKTLVTIMRTFDSDSKILPAFPSPQNPLKPITEVAQIPKSDTDLMKFLHLSYVGNLDSVPTHDLKGNPMKQESIFASARIFTSTSRNAFIKGISGKCKDKEIKVLVKACQHVVTKKAYAIAMLHHSLCNDGLTSLFNQVFDECLEAEAHQLKTEKRSIEIVIRSNEYKMPKAIKEDEMFAKYLKGRKAKLLYMKHITCPIEQHALLADLIKTCYPTLRRLLGYTICFIPIGRSPHMPPNKELKAHLRN